MRLFRRLQLTLRDKEFSVLETKKIQATDLIKTSKRHPEQEYELRLFDMAIAQPGHNGYLFYGTEAEVRAKLKEIGESDTRIIQLFAMAA
jgi:hypothetical protein